jgi:hypothetical protein
MNGLRRIGPLLAVGLLLAAAAVAAALANPQVRRVPLIHPTPAAPPTGATSAPTGQPARPTEAAGQVPHAVQVPGWLIGLLNALCVAVVVAVVGGLIWFLVRDRLAARRRPLFVEEEPAQPMTPRREAVLAAVDAGLSDLDARDSDPRRAVIACWVRLEQAAAAAGTPRQPGDSPTDLVARLLSAHQVSARVLLALAEVYRIARYATHVVDSGMRDQARAALRQLRDELTTSRSGPLAPEPAGGGPR